jgi:hypothetical protein
LPDLRVNTLMSPLSLLSSSPPSSAVRACPGPPVKWTTVAAINAFVQVRTVDLIEVAASEVRESSKGYSAGTVLAAIAVGLGVLGAFLIASATQKTSCRTGGTGIGYCKGD